MTSRYAPQHDKTERFIIHHPLSILHLYKSHPGVAALAHALKLKSGKHIFCPGLRASSAPVVFACLAEKTACPYLFMLNDEEEAGYFYHDLTQLMGEEQVLFYPSTYRRAVKYAQRDAANEILRTEVLSRLSAFSEENGEAGKALLIVTFPAAISERVAPKQKLDENSLCLHEGESVDFTQLTTQLRELGFHRRDYVYEPGEYAVRGSIIDVYSFASDLPIRIDFFGDEIDSIRNFEVQTQLSKDRLKEAIIVPEIDFKADALVPFTDFLPPNTLLVSRDLTFVIDKVQSIYNEGFAQQAVQEREATSEMEADEIKRRFSKELQLIEGSLLQRQLLGFRRIDIGAHAVGDTPATEVKFSITPQPAFHKNFELVEKSLLELQNEGYIIYIASDSPKQNERLKNIFEEMGGGVQFKPLPRTLHEGFIDAGLRLCIFTDHQIFDRYHKYNLRSEKARGGKIALTLKEIMQFEPGDYIVHVDHGVGKFAGLVRTPSADGTMQEVIKLVYQNDDVVLVSIHALHKVSKYKGKEGEPPRLNKLGTGAWEKLKDRTKKKIKDIARDLILLYSKRRSEKGFAFSADSFMQHELEASFIYEDTPDQLKVTAEVKADMEQAVPMDRLVCGDVGFGKTEIAVRAALKAAADNKQVAVLVPTTVLAYQHFQTFKSRLKDFPVRVDYLSRARTPQQTAQILKDLAEGNIGILVGTHKLIGKSVKWKDLGLLIIDEEQKFGVAVKERLRQVKVNVDTLTMSATPIPRTLQFSMMGARDFSVIQTPPPNRHPINTEIHTFGHEVIADAVNFEMSRNGQVYIVSNRISDLPHLANLLQQYVPDARVCIGHGQMSPAELEKIIFDFVNYDYDVLISTTIVENGIDIPNANTIIINNAQHFGLSDLHQMRGRVGRGNRKAFCYLLAPPLSVLPDESRRRLQAIENFSDLGSGIHIAMQDLDIRGAGNLLGAEQSGFIADLGYETYQKILAEAMAELRNEEPASFEQSETENEKGQAAKAAAAPHSAQSGADGNLPAYDNNVLFVDDCSIECDLHAFFPETYVPGASERMLLYRELDSFTTDEQIEAFRKRMLDRFGEMPPEGEELLCIVKLRREAKKLGCERLLLKNGNMSLYFVSNPNSPFYRSPAFELIINYATANFRRCELREKNGKRHMTIKAVGSVKDALEVLLVCLNAPAMCPAGNRGQ